MGQSESKLVSFIAVNQWNVQILRFAQDDRTAFRCHPERSEGSVRRLANYIVQIPQLSVMNPKIEGPARSGTLALNDLFLNR